MTHDPRRTTATPSRWESLERVLANGGEMGARVREHDWTSTPLGDPTTWPRNLRMALGFTLASRFPMGVFWGEEFTMLYNDAYASIPGDKHPHCLGQPGAQVWAEVWDTIGSLFRSVLAGDPAVWAEDLQLFVNRHGYAEECYFTFSYSPIADDDEGIGGVLVTVTETTARVLSERRLRTLRRLAEHTDHYRDERTVCQEAVTALGEAAADLPFVAVYLHEVSTDALWLAASTTPDVAPEDGGGLPLREVLGTGTAVVAAQPLVAAPAGSTNAYVVPIDDAGQEAIAGVMVVGTSPYRDVDVDFRDFVDLVAGRLATNLADARAYEAERTRAEALAELDRAKTAFVSSVSHEFRTPLTLMLGPVADALAVERDQQQRNRLELVSRNGQRLLRLVNSLLDFSRMEAGRADVTYAPVLLDEATSHVSSLFRSAVEQAGLLLDVHTEPLDQPVWVDLDMWEKIVLNLLSNALKFTFEGSISVHLTQEGQRAVLTVSDTGTGIAAQDVPRLFERFHRVRGARARTQEGSGIGLALVRELVALHGGSIEVNSTPGQGSSFEVTVPFGHAHLPSDRLAATRRDVAGVTDVSAHVGVGVGIERRAAGRARPFVDETRQWLGPSDHGGGDCKDGAAETATAATDGVIGSSVMLVDDNADLRGYLSDLLAPSYRVTAVSDGAQALQLALADPPDLVVTDGMMPGLDGLALLRALRSDLRTARVPVIMLSARVGEDAAVEGLEAGADDYLAKPFSSRELLARVRASLQLARLREEATRAAESHAARLQSLADASLALSRSATLAAVLDTSTQQARLLLGARHAVTTLSPEASVNGHTHERPAEHPAQRSPSQGRLVVPLIARDGAHLGLIEVSAREQGGDFTAEDRSVLIQLAQMAGVRIENARLFERERDVAVALQRSLLPQATPIAPGLTVASRYLPGAAGTEVGGDWYDVIELAGGRTGLVIGDVLGRGIRAAAVMGQLRAVLRGYALEDVPPADVLSRLDVVVRSFDATQLTTCTYGVYDPVAATLTIATSGHLPPLVIDPGGTASYLVLDPGLPLGVGGLVDDPGYRATTVDLPPGSSVLLFTDGLVEDHDLSVGDGLDQLQAAMFGPVSSAEDLCDRALQALGRDISHDDDTALLAFCALPKQGPCARAGAGQRADVLELAPEQESARLARSFVSGRLHDWGNTGVVDAAVLLVSELVTNAVLHTGQPLRLNISLSPAALTVAVTDLDPTPPRMNLSVDTMSEGGRGLLMVDLLASRWGVEAQATGKRVWFELDLAPSDT